MNKRNILFGTVFVFGGSFLSFAMELSTKVEKEQGMIDEPHLRFKKNEMGTFLNMFPQSNEQQQVLNNQGQVVQNNVLQTNKTNNTQKQITRSEKKEISSKQPETKKRVEQINNKQISNKQRKSKTNNQKQFVYDSNQPAILSIKEVEAQKQAQQKSNNKIEETSIAVVSEKSKIINQPESKLPSLTISIAELKEKMTNWSIFRLCSWQSKDLAEETKGLFIEHVKEKDDERKTLLHHAAKNGLLNIVKSLVNDGADINAEDSEDALFTNAKVKRTALHYAVQNGHIEVVKFLMDKGAQDIRDSQGNTLLHYAASSLSSLRNNSEMMCFVIEKNPASVKSTNNNLVTPLHNAVFQGNEGSVEILIKNGAHVNAKDNNQHSPLQHNTLYHGLNTKKIMKLLVKNGADPDTKISGNDWTPLLSAIQEDDMELIELLVEKKADIHAKDELGNTVLRYAALSPNPKILKFFLEKTDIKKDINVKDGIQGTPLFDACQKGNYENAKILIEYGADVNAKGERTYYPSKDTLEAAAKSEFYIAPGIKKPRIDDFIVSFSLYPKAEEGYAPLHIASHNGHDKIVDLLLEKDADVNSVSETQTIPLHLAAYKGHVSIVTKLLKAGANPNIETIETYKTCSVPDVGKNYVFGESRYTAKGVTSLFAAILGGKSEIVKILAPKSEVHRTVGAFNASALHLAVLSGNLDSVKMLVNECNANFLSLLRGKHRADEIADCYEKKDIAQFLGKQMEQYRKFLEHKSLKERMLDSNDVPFGVYYRTKDGGIRPVSMELKEQMVSNHLLNLDYSACPKKNNNKDFFHAFSEDIEKKFGEYSCVVIDSKDPDKIRQDEKKFDLFVTLSGKFVEKEGVFEFKIRKTLYEETGKCLHRFHNLKGNLGAQGFGADFRKKEQKKINLFLK